MLSAFDLWEDDRSSRPSTVGTAVRPMVVEHRPPSPKPPKNYDFFRSECCRLHKSNVLSWRRLLDPEMLGRVSLVQFCRKTKLIVFTHEQGRVDVRAVFYYLDRRGTGYLTLEDWDEATFRHLMLFRQLCIEEYCTMEKAFKHGMDLTGSATVDLATLTEFAEDYEYSGDVGALFKALDLRCKGYLVEDDIVFLANWGSQAFRPERFRVSAGRKALNRPRRKWKHIPGEPPRVFHDVPFVSVPVIDAGHAFKQAAEHIERVLVKPRVPPLQHASTWRRMSFRDFEPDTPAS